MANNDENHWGTLITWAYKLLKEIDILVRALICALATINEPSTAKISAFCFKLPNGDQNLLFTYLSEKSNNYANST